MTDIHEIESLKERIARIEQTVKEIQESVGAPDDQGGEGKGDAWWGDGDKDEKADLSLNDTEIQLVQNGKKIEAVKLFHERTGVGLKASKDAVDRFESGAG